MAIFEYPYPGTKGETKVSYEGKVVGKTSHGSHNDDYYYAIVYELDENGTPQFSNVMYDTTAFAVSGGAKVDAPQWVIDYREEQQRKIREAEMLAARKRDIRRGIEVRVIKGRKVKIGTEARVFWVGQTRFGRSVGLEMVSGERVFTAERNVEAILPQ